MRVMAISVRLRDSRCTDRNSLITRSLHPDEDLNAVVSKVDDVDVIAIHGNIGGPVESTVRAPVFTEDGFQVTLPIEHLNTVVLEICNVDQARITCCDTRSYVELPR